MCFIRFLEKGKNQQAKRNLFTFELWKLLPSEYITYSLEIFKSLGQKFMNKFRNTGFPNFYF